MKIDKNIFEEARVALDLECNLSKYEDCSSLASALNGIIDFENDQGKRVITDTFCRISFNVLIDNEGGKLLAAGINSEINGKKIWHGCNGILNYEKIGNEEELVSLLENIYKEGEVNYHRLFPDKSA